jgi:deoxyadenosine/deoxycytidine kinase
MIAQYPYIAVEGNIGAGKTTLAKLIAEDSNIPFFAERFEENPFLPLFYKSPEQYALPLELSFLEDRFRQFRNELPQTQSVVSDYLFDKSLVFARINLSGHELDLFEKFFDHFAGFVRRPDLIIYLHRPVEQLQRNIRSRGRVYEQGIPGNYLSRIEGGYRKYLYELSTPPVLWVETGDASPEMLYQRIRNEVGKRALSGLTEIALFFNGYKETNKK